MSSGARIRVLVADTDVQNERSLVEVLNRDLEDCEAFSLRENAAPSTACSEEELLRLLRAQGQSLQCHIVVVSHDLLKDLDTGALADANGALKPARCVLHMGDQVRTLDVMRALEAGLLVSSPIGNSNLLYKPMDWIAEQFVWQSRAKNRLSISGTISPEEIASRIQANDGLVVTGDEVCELLEYLFPKARKLSVRTLGDSPHDAAPRAHSILVSVIEIDEDEHALVPVAVKIAPSIRIAKEADKYKSHIKGRLSGMRHTYLERFELRWKLGGIVYSFLGVVSAQDADPRPLHTFSRHYATYVRSDTTSDRDEKMVYEILAEVFRSIWGPLYHDRKRSTETVFNQYKQSWGDGWLDRNRLSELAKSGSWHGRPSEYLKLPNPAAWLADHLADSGVSDEAITHGDMHLDNILLDDTHHSWLIDFERSGLGPALQDFGELQFDLLTRTDILDTTRNDWPLLYDLFVSVSAPRNPAEDAPLTRSLSEQRRTSPIRKVLRTTNEVRRLARDLVAYDDYSTFLWSLLLNAIYINMRALPAHYSEEEQAAEQTRRDRAWLLASVVCGRLDIWTDSNAAWPPSRWPTVRFPDQRHMLSSREASSPGLQLSVRESDQALSYELNDPDGREFFRLAGGEIHLRKAGSDILQQTFDRLSALAHGSPKTRTPDTTQYSIRKLDVIGRNLYDELLPEQFKQIYRSRLRTEYAGKSILIASENAFIPWEIVKPGEEKPTDGEPYSDEHFCERFCLSRWLPGIPIPGQIEVSRIAIVRPPNNLQAAREEVAFLSALSQPGIEVAESLDTISSVLDSFSEGAADLYHFVCHGNFDRTDPKESKLRLMDGYLSPADIVDEPRLGLQRARPIIFLNACHSGEAGYGLIRLDGWAHRFVRAGARAFIGTLWEVHDELATRFAIEFYIRLLGKGDHKKMTLGQAFRDARLVVKAQDPANPTWLAYVLYGNPNSYWQT